VEEGEEEEEEQEGMRGRISTTDQQVCVMLHVCCMCVVCVLH